VHEQVNLGDVEMFADSKLDKDLFMHVEQTQAVLHV